MRIVIATALLITTSVGYPFGHEAHRAIANAAEQKLSDSTKAKIRQVLGSETMAEAALWPDQAAKSPAPDAVAFRERHPDSEKWHNTHIPIHTVYTRDSEFARSNDIVHSIDRCVAVLEGRSDSMTRPEALRWLIHLMGDLHQPLHVGTYYYKLLPVHRLAVAGEPREARGKMHDQSGELLKLGKNTFSWYWDEHMVSYVKERTTGVPLEKTILDRIPKLRVKKNEGGYQDWVTHWASDSLVAARKAYEGVSFGETRSFKLKSGETKWYVNVRLDPQPLTYEDAHLELAKDQLAKAALRLSELLQAIRWSDEVTPAVAAR